MSERRRHHRTAPRRPQLRALLELGGRGVEGRVLDLTASGAGVVLLREQTADLPIGTETILSLESPLLLRTVRLKVCVRQWREVGALLLVGLEFADRAIAQHQIPGLLRQDFNRRRAPRLPLEPPPPATLRYADGQSVKAELLNIGVGGVGLRMDRDRYRSGPASEEVELSFRIPGEPREFALAARVVGEESVATRTTLNLEFREDSSDEHREQIALIGAMVAVAGGAATSS